MPLVDYSSSEEEQLTATENTASHKRKRDHETDSSTSSSLPPLPSKFHDLYASGVRASTHDDPTLHGGRKRITPHIEGNWPTHVYIEWYPSPTEFAILSDIVSDVKKNSNNLSSLEVHTLLSSDLGATLPLHISLSRPIGFLTDKKDNFSHSLSEAIRTSGVRPFKVTFDTLNWESNFEKTRWFLVLRIKPPPNNELNKLLHTTNTVVQDYDQPPLYSAPRPYKIRSRSTEARNALRRSDLDTSTVQDWSTAFHFSIAWTLKEPNEETKKATLNYMERRANELKNISVNVDEIKNKVGNVVHNLDLVKREVEGGSLFGL